MEVTKLESIFKGGLSVTKDRRFKDLSATKYEFDCDGKEYSEIIKIERFLDSLGIPYDVNFYIQLEMVEIELKNAPCYIIQGDKEVYSTVLRPDKKDYVKFIWGKRGESDYISGFYQSIDVAYLLVELLSSSN